MIRTALIDMDGVLYDSMPLHVSAWKTLTQEMGLDIPCNDFYLYEGMTGEETIKLLSKKYLDREFSKKECQSLYNRKAELFNSMDSPSIMNGAIKVLKYLKEKGIKCVVVTGSGQNSLIDKIESDFPGIFNKELMVTSHNVVNGKPHPEPYLKGASLSRTSVDECIAIENAPLGVESASRASVFTIAVNTGNINPELLKSSGANVVVPDMNACYFYLKNNTFYNQ